MLKEFQEFIGRSNVIGLAVALMMGAAFGSVVTSFTNDILMQLVAAIGAKPDFKDLALSVNGTPIRYGSFLTAILSFFIVAVAMFLVIKATSRFQPKKEPVTETELDVLRQIREALIRR